MQRVTVVGGSPCPACGGRYSFRTVDAVTLCITCRFTKPGLHLFRGMAIQVRRDGGIDVFERFADSMKATPILSRGSRAVVTNVP